MATRLYRRKDEKVIAGVCSGLADYFDIDVAIIRVIFLATAITWGISIIIYIFFWIAMPVGPKQTTEQANLETSESKSFTSPPISRKSGRKSREILAIILIIIGIFATLDNLLTWFSGRLWIPMVLITLGILILFYTNRKDEHELKEADNESN
ncbi:MAG: PspC domain-containing protein [Candidatus Kapaibacteriota bacterium]